MEIDCALLMMLDEERERFTAHNHHLIIREPDSDGFVPFIFFDKDGKLRNGIIYSYGKKMGNTEACKLFYKFSRKYRAHLYINLGVAGYFSDINIGDVLFADRLSTLSEDNATNVKWQSKDGRFRANFPNFSQSFIDSFEEKSKQRIDDFHKQLNLYKDKEEISELLEVDVNKITAGRCLTVPEVVKGDKENSRIPIIRKGNVIDMEAYYLFEWYELIKEQEPWCAIEGSSFLVFKSVSDMADTNKTLVEKCGSRDLAMANLCDVVCTYLTDVHTFERETKEDIRTYFQSEISNQSLDPLFLQASTVEQTKAFGKFCRYFITADTEEAFGLEKDCVSAACDFLSFPQKALLLKGHSGTGKSTYISYVFHAIRNGRMAIIIDFSKFTNDTVPTDTQIIYLFQRLLAYEKNITVFLDGVDIDSEIYNELLGVIKSGTYTNLSLCIGDISNEQLSGAETRNPWDLLPSNATVNTYSFGGLSIYSPQLESMIENAKLYFDSISGKQLNKEKIINFIHSSGLSHVDFRLLKMLATYEEQIGGKKDFYGFIDWYCATNVRREITSSLYSYIPFTLAQNNKLSSEQRYAFHILCQNSYMRAFLFANCIVEIVINDNPETMGKLFESDYLLSNDMNLYSGAQTKKECKNKRRFCSTFAILPL